MPISVAPSSRGFAEYNPRLNRHRVRLARDPPPLSLIFSRYSSYLASFYFFIARLYFTIRVSQEAIVSSLKALCSFFVRRAINEDAGSEEIVSKLSLTAKLKPNARPGKLVSLEYLQFLSLSLFLS